MGQNVDGSELVDFPNGRKIYPEVAEYLNSRITSTRAYDDAVLNADRAYTDAETALQRAAEDAGRTYDSHGLDREAHRANRRARDEAFTAAAEAQQEASRDLLLNSPHKEVKWVAENCLFANQGTEVEDYALAILKIMPATVEEIWTEAKDNRGMCDVFDRFYEQAERDGVFSDGVPTPGYREVAAFRNYIRRSYGSSYVRDFQPHLDRVVKALREQHEAELDAARAVWQHLDEARAEQASRNRSAAATAAHARRREAQQEAQTSPEAMAEDIRHGHRTVISTQSAMTGEIIRSEVPQEEKVDA